MLECPESRDIVADVPTTEVTASPDTAASKGKPKTKQAVKQGSTFTLSPPAPWHEAVEGAALLDDLSRFFAEHAFLPSGAADLLAVWTLHTYCYVLFRHTPRLSITSPEKGSGKTTVLDLLEMMVRKPMSVANITPAAVFRSIEKLKPTLLVDEADTFLSGRSELRGVLDAGHKSGGRVVRCVGDDSEPRGFDVFAAVAIAGLGALPGTLADRAI